jgi:IS1 family transposase
MLVKAYRLAPEGSQRRYSPAECLGAQKHRVERNTNLKLISTSYFERNNGIILQHCNRCARLIQAFSNMVENHVCAFALHGN